MRLGVIILGSAAAAAAGCAGAPPTPATTHAVAPSGAPTGAAGWTDDRVATQQGGAGPTAGATGGARFGLADDRPAAQTTAARGANLDVTRAQRSVAGAWTGLRALVPAWSWQPLPGRVVGLLYATGAQPWGGIIDAAVNVGTSRDDQYQFGFGRSNGYAVYFRSDGRGTNFLERWSVPTPAGEARFDAAMFSPATPDPWGLDRPAHLVEVEVNEGRGSTGSGPHFVITDVRVLDGTSACAFDPVAVLTALRAQFDASLRPHRAAAQRLLDAQRAEASGDARPTDPLTEHLGLWPTWDPDARVLHVLVGARAQQHLQAPPRQQPVQCPPCPPGAPCAACPPYEMVTPRWTLRWEAAARYRVGPDGALLEEVLYPPVRPAS